MSNIISLDNIIIVLLIGVVIFQRKEINSHNRAKERLNKYYKLLNIWLYQKNNNKSIGEYIRDKNYKRIAIYGMGEIGGRLYEELKLSGIKVEAFIEKETGDYTHGYGETPLISIEELGLYDFDIIIVTPIFDFKNIYESIKRLNEKFDIISIEELIK